MANFTALTRRKSAGADETSGRELSESERRALPLGFEAVGEALVSANNPSAASAEVGRAFARDGASLGEALDGLSATYFGISGTEAGFEAAKALSIAWSESTLEFLHQLSCEDPLTGLATLAHVRTRLDEIYRENENQGTDTRTSHALVIVEALSVSSDHFGRALMLAQVAEALRSVYSGGETIGRVGSDRAIALVRRWSDLGPSVALLREYLNDLKIEATQIRVWIEGLPGTADSATRLLDELAR